MPNVDAPLLTFPGRALSTGRVLFGKGGPCWLIFLLSGIPLMADEPSSDDALLEEVLQALSPWQTVADISVWGGQKDNVLLSPYRPEASPFVGLEMEGVVSRSLGASSGFEAYGLLDYRHYTGVDELDNEWLAFGVVEFEHDLGLAWQAGLGLEYSFQDQVVDVSTTQADLDIVELVGHSGGVRPRVRWTLSANHSFELEPMARRDLYAQPLDDLWTWGTHLTWLYQPVRATEWTLGYSFEHRRYDTDEALDLNGTPIDGVRRTGDRHEIEAGWNQYWDSSRRWRTRLRMRSLFNLDPPAGYYDYTQVQASFSLRYRHPRWGFELTPRYSRYWYDNQTVSLDNPELRERNEFSAQCRVEWNVHSRVVLFADYTFEQTLSNRPEERYEVHTAGGGVRYEF